MADFNGQTATITNLSHVASSAAPVLPVIPCCNDGWPVLKDTIDPSWWSSSPEDFDSVRSAMGHNPLPPRFVSDDYRHCTWYMLNVSRMAFAFDVQTDLLKLACRCRTGFSGEHCELRTMSLTSGHGGDGHSFRIFLMLAVIPLVFSFLAALFGFLLKSCCCSSIGIDWSYCEPLKRLRIWRCCSDSKQEDSDDGQPVSDSRTERRSARRRSYGDYDMDFGDGALDAGGDVNLGNSFAASRYVNTDMDSNPPRKESPPPTYEEAMRNTTLCEAQMPTALVTKL